MEAAYATANSSKVIVQCHDPNNLFDRVALGLEPRLPLSKLHWKSPNRPLRSIDQLHVSFVPDQSKADNVTTARRHQIPGLRQTPFVKVFLVRCDDREAYKETTRKEVKQWLKSQGISQDGKTLMKGQERHDAYEYIILHVVLPGTPAATQPKSSKHISLDATDSTDSVNSKSKWTGKSSSTIFDKLRADFSSSSKAPFERVAQVRIVDSEIKQPIGLGPSEVEEQWQDFVDKLKTAILLSFDARVAQYEEDIRERESQRNLPGWNFCTFFILKEGLARGFENVGLIEDALSAYEELDAGLDSLVQDHASRYDTDPAGALLPFSNDLKPAIREALDAETEGIDNQPGSDVNLALLTEQERDNFPFDIERKHYQQRILTNQVSSLDFHIYTFTRQLQLLFRRARVTLVPPRSSHTGNTTLRGQYDLNAIAGICEKAASFINFATRALRRDLYAAWGGQEGLTTNELETQKAIIGGIVASWRWSATIQVLADCHIPVLLSNILTEHTPSGKHIVDDSHKNGQSSPVNENLALWTGELISMARGVLQDLVLSNDQPLSENDAWKGLQSQALKQSFYSKGRAAAIFKLLTVHAYQCYKASDRLNVSHRMLHDLAEIELTDSRVNQAIWWLEHIPDLRNLYARTATDRIVLKLYAKCLKQQGKHDEYAATLISLLLSSATSPIARRLPQYDEQTQYILDELTGISDDISPVDLQLGDFVLIQETAKTISHEEQVHGFTIPITLSLRFNATMQIPNMKLVMVAANGQEPQEIVMENINSLTIDGFDSVVEFVSNTITEGWYDMAKLSMKIGKLNFEHNFRVASLTEHNKLVTKQAPIMVYPHRDAFLVTTMHSTVADLTKPGRLLFKLAIGANKLEECVLRVRPATAGVRLDIQAANVCEESSPASFSIVRQDDVNVLVFQNLASCTQVEFEIPYSSEILTDSISIKIEASCREEATTFLAVFQRLVTVNLPISVNVQDIFQVNRIFSRFTAVPSTIIPVRVLRWDVDSTQDLEVLQSSMVQEPIDIFARMPASWVIEVVQQHVKDGKQSKLPLTVQYQSFDEIILQNIESQFRRDLQEHSSDVVSELLVSHLLTQIPLLWHEQELETAALLQEFELYSYESLNWDNTLRALASRRRKETEAWLRSWHARHERLDLDLAQARIRLVKLSVEMPKPTTVMSTSVHLHMSDKRHLALGETVSAEVIINCAFYSEDEHSNGIQYEIATQPDTWLIGGRKRGAFLPHSKEHRFNIILIAQKTGHLLLPTVDIKSQSQNERGDPVKLNLETENKGQARSVLVIPNLQSTTVVMSSDATTSRHWLLESQRRQQSVEG